MTDDTPTLIVSDEQFDDLDLDDAGTETTFSLLATILGSDTIDIVRREDEEP